MIRLTDLAGNGSFSMGGKKFEYGKVYSNPNVTAFKPVNEAEGEDHEVSMAQNQLDSIIKHATELKQKVGEQEKDIPAWIQDHITNSENYISQAASNYHEYKANESRIAEDSPCWKGYKQVGMKNKNGRQVPNCVPEGVVKEGPMNLRGGVPKMYVAYLGLQKKVRELEDKQKQLLQPYLAAKKSNNVTAINKAVETLKKNQKSLEMYRRNLQKVEGEYITMLDRDIEYQGEE
jgi:hypothetical protein